MTIYNYLIAETNKNHFIINVFCRETICVGRLQTYTVDFLYTRYAKISVNKLFTNISNVLTVFNYFNHL